MAIGNNLHCNFYGKDNSISSGLANGKRQIIEVEKVSKNKGAYLLNNSNGDILPDVRRNMNIRAGSRDDKDKGVRSLSKNYSRSKRRGSLTKNNV